MFQKELGLLVAEEMAYILKQTGSDAGERQEPGSKLGGQLERIHEFVNQVESARIAVEEYRSEFSSDMIRIIIGRASDHS